MISHHITPHFAAVSSTAVALPTGTWWPVRISVERQHGCDHDVPRTRSQFWCIASQGPTSAIASRTGRPPSVTLEVRAFLTDRTLAGTDWHRGCNGASQLRRTHSETWVSTSPRSGRGPTRRARQTGAYLWVSSVTTRSRCSARCAGVWRPGGGFLAGIWLAFGCVQVNSH